MVPLELQWKVNSRKLQSGNFPIGFEFSTAKPSETGRFEAKTQFI